MTPATYRAGGKGARVTYASAATPLGRVLVGATERGICFVALGENDRELTRALEAEFPAADRVEGGSGLREFLTEVVSRVRGQAPDQALPLDVRATAFQRKVWEELRRIPLGQTLSYSELAHRIGQPKAIRAVASACARNNVAVVIPCHRVVRSSGELGGYRWGLDRKKRLLAREGSPR